MQRPSAGWLVIARVVVNVVISPYDIPVSFTYRTTSDDRYNMGMCQEWKWNAEGRYDCERLPRVTSNKEQCSLTWVHDIRIT